MTKNYKINKLRNFWFSVIAVFMSSFAVAQTCSFTVTNSGAIGGDTEYYLQLDEAGNIAAVILGGSSVTLTGAEVGSVTQFLYLVYDSTNPPTNVPPQVGNNPADIVGCTNDFMGSPIFLECLCSSDLISATYNPGTVSGDLLQYFLTDETGLVVETNTSGNFGIDESNGDYFIYALNYDSANPPSTIPVAGANISDFSNDGCYNSDFLNPGCCVQKIGCCPDVLTENDSATICSGGLANEIIDWQNNLEADPTIIAAVADINTDATIIYSTTMNPTEAIPPVIGTADGIHTAPTSCALENQITFAYILCYGPNGVVGGGDDVYILAGVFTLIVYPAIQTPNEAEVLCTNTITTFCSDILGVASNPTGGAMLSNWNASTGVYTSLPGDLAGTIDIMITSSIVGSPCTDVVTITTPACPAGCPAVTPINGAASICSGSLTDEITTWQTALEADASVIVALSDSNTDNSITYSTVPTNLNDASCTDLLEMMTATINCFGADGIDDSGANDDMLITLGTYSLTTFPAAQDPLDGLINCVNTPVINCTGDGFSATASNATGGADISNWDGSMYTAQPGDLAGTVEISVTTTNGCMMTHTIATPACPIDCMAMAPTISHTAGTCTFSSDEMENTTGTFITEYIVTDGPSGIIIDVFGSLAEAETAALAENTANGDACIQAINHEGLTDIIANVDAQTGGLLCSSGLVVCPVNELSVLYGALAGAGAALTAADVIALIGPPGEGVTGFDLGVLINLPAGFLVVDIPPFCYALGNEDCITTAECIDNSCMAMAPTINHTAGTCTFISDEMENTTGTFITEYIVTDGPNGTIINVFGSLAEAETAALAENTANGDACIQAINHEGLTDIIANVDAQTGGLLCSSGLVVCPVNELSVLYGALAGAGAALTAADVIALIGPPGEGVTGFDLGVLINLPAGFLVVDIPPFCYALGNEDCITTAECVPPVECNPNSGIISLKSIPAGTGN